MTRPHLPGGARRRLPAAARLVLGAVLLLGPPVAGAAEEPAGRATPPEVPAGNAEARPALPLRIAGLARRNQPGAGNAVLAGDEVIVEVEGLLDPKAPPRFTIGGEEADVVQVDPAGRAVVLRVPGGLSQGSHPVRLLPQASGAEGASATVEVYPVPRAIIRAIRPREAAAGATVTVEGSGFLAPARQIRLLLGEMTVTPRWVAPDGTSFVATLDRVERAGVVPVAASIWGLPALVPDRLELTLRSESRWDGIARSVPWVALIGVLLALLVSFLRGKKPKDPDPDKLTPEEIAKLSWVKPEDVRRSLASVFAAADRRGASAIDWYGKKSRPKKAWALWLRMTAIVATALAGILPILVQMRWSIEPAWASVAVAIGVSLVLLDHFFGFSSSWMRFMDTEQRLRRRCDQFRLDWVIDSTRWNDTEIATQAATALDKCRAFVLEVDQVVADETGAWIQEFRASIKDFDQEVKGRAEKMAETGALSLMVTNGELCEKGWRLAIDDGLPTDHTGKTAAVTGLSAGMHRLVVEGMLATVPKRAESVVQVAAGGIATSSVTL